MTKEERIFIEVLTTEVGTSLTISHDRFIIGTPTELEEPIEIPLSTENLEIIKDIKKPLLDKIHNMLEEGDYNQFDLPIIKAIQDKLT